MMKKRLILVVGGDTDAMLRAALRELSEDKYLEKHGSIGGLRCGAAFDYSLDTTAQGISISDLFHEVEAGIWGKSKPPRLKYLVVARRKGYRNWGVEEDDLPKTAAIKAAQDYAKAHPGERVEVWVDMTITQVVKKVATR